MKFSKQTLLGSAVLLGGSVLLYATVHQVLTSKSEPVTEDKTAVVTKPVQPTQSGITNEPLTADVDTEKNILAQKQKEREQRVAAQERETQQYLTEQQRIEAQALARSRAENQIYANKAAKQASITTAITQPVVTARPVETTQTTEPTKPTATETSLKKTALANNTTTVVNNSPAVSTAVVQNQPVSKSETKPTETIIPSSYQVKAGEGLIGLSRRYNIPIDALAAANNLNKNANLHVGQTLTIPSPSHVQQLQQQARQREQERQNAVLRQQQEAVRKKQEIELKRQQEIARKKQEALQKEQQRQQKIAQKKQELVLKEQQKQQYQEAQDKLRQARQIAKETDAKGKFGVQIALATDDAKAQEITQKLQAAGYKVKTSQTTRGIRIVVGPETGKVAALALKDKINNDSRVDVKNGWVLYW